MWFMYGLKAQKFLAQGVWSSLAKLELLKNSVKDNKKSLLVWWFLIKVLSLQ